MQFEDLVNKVVSPTGIDFGDGIDLRFGDGTTAYRDIIDQELLSDTLKNPIFTPWKDDKPKVEVIKCKNCEKKDKEIEELKQKLNLALEMAQNNYEKYCNLLKGE